MPSSKSLNSTLGDLLSYINCPNSNVTQRHTCMHANVTGELPSKGFYQNVSLYQNILSNHLKISILGLHFMKILNGFLF